MAERGPGKAYRVGISLMRLGELFPNDERAREWLAAQIWPNDSHCPHYGSRNVQIGIKHKAMTHRCRDCPTRPRFSLKMGSIMQASNLGYRDWAIAIYLLTTSLRSVSAMRLHRILELAYSSAWHLAHRLWEAFADGSAAMLHGPGEADEIFMSGKRKNMPKSKRKELTGRGVVGKTAVVDVKNRDIGRIAARKGERTGATSLQGMIREHLEPGSTLYADEVSAYAGMFEHDHETVNRSVGEYIRDMDYTNGVESFWAMLKRCYQGTFRHLSEWRLDHYVGELAAQRNICESHTESQMAIVARRSVGKRLCYWDLVK